MHFGQHQLTIAFHSENFFLTQYAKVMGITIVFQDFYLYNNHILNLQLYYTLYSNTTFETVVDSEYQFLKDCLSIFIKIMHSIEITELLVNYI